MSTRAKICGLLVAAAVCALLVAAASHDTNAYFTDVHGGTVTGRFGTWASGCPYRLTPGRSKAEFWSSSGSGTSHQPIAQYDASGDIRLDFGDMRQGSSGSWCDVLRLTSLTKTPQTVTFNVSGALAPYVTSVRFAGCGSGVLKAGATASVAVTMSLAKSLKPGIYGGTLTIHVAGWSPDTKLPITLTVCSEQGHHDSRSKSKHPQPEPKATPAVTPAATPWASPTAAAPTPSPSATPTPQPTPSATPAPSSSSPSASPTPEASGG